MKFRNVTAGIALMAATSLAFADLEEASTAYQKGDYKAALQELRPLAEKGDPEAQHNLGVMYAEGQGVQKDLNEAAKWLRLAAEQGHSLAQFYLGIFYREGVGVQQDSREAVKWIKLSAEQGNQIAQYNLGTMYDEGKNIQQDYKEAIKWYGLAADQGAMLGVNARVRQREIENQLIEDETYTNNPLAKQNTNTTNDVEIKFSNTIKFIKNSRIESISACMAGLGAMGDAAPDLKEHLAAILSIQWALIKEYRGEEGVSLATQYLDRSFSEIERIGLTPYLKLNKCHEFNKDVSSYLAEVN